jgi:alkaline phosphatase D
MSLIHSFLLLQFLLSSITHGPLLGDLTSDSVRIWIRADAPEKVEIVLQDLKNEATPSHHYTVITTEENDFTARFHAKNLKPNTKYTYTINGVEHDDWWFKTRPLQDETVRIAFGSCANEKEGSSKVWNRMNADKIDALVLLGDTPYIDTTDLTVQRKRYKAFSGVPAFASLLAHTPLYATWDDHDFGRNDTDGNLEGKEFSRQAFSEYRPNPSIGENNQGIYTKFKQGPVEIFLLDARWFARTETSHNIPTLLGKQQWNWLERALKASTSPYKILASGMIFNGATRPGKTDHWGAYPTEYLRLLSIIKRNNISGVILVSGDVHWSRVIKHNTTDTIGYDVHEFITSPIHEKLIVAADAYHEGLVFSIGEPNSFLLLESNKNEDSISLNMSLQNAIGETLYSFIYLNPPSMN